MKTFVPSKKEKKTKNIETRDFSTPTEWNVEMVNDKVIVTLSGEKKKNTGVFLLTDSMSVSKSVVFFYKFATKEFKLGVLTTVQIYVLSKIRSENELGKVTADCRVFSLSFFFFFFK